MLPSDIGERDNRKMWPCSRAAIRRMTGKNLWHWLRPQGHQAIADAPSNLSKGENIWQETARIFKHKPLSRCAEEALDRLRLINIPRSSVAGSRATVRPLMALVPFCKSRKATFM